MFCALIGLIACLMSALALPALAGTISIETIGDASSAKSVALQRHTVRLTGIIAEGDAEKLHSVLARLRSAARTVTQAPLPAVELSSRGGDFYEGMKIGELVHDFPIATVVRKGDICLSACALAFLGGASAIGRSVVPDRRLEIGGKLGFHSFSLSLEQQRHGAMLGFNRARGAAASEIAYAARMGIDPDFIARILGRPTEEFEYVETAGDFMRLAICPLDLARPDIPLATQAINISNNMTSLADTADSLRATPISARRVHRLLLETVQTTMMSSRVKGALSDQLASYSVMRNDRATADLYEDLRAAGLPLPEIVGPTFEISGYRAGMYDLHTVVSLSASDPDRYDLVTIGPKGIAPPSRSAPANCRRLVLYDRNDRLNP